MTAGFIPDHTFNFHLEGITPQHFMVLAVETARSLNWNITFLTQNGLIANTYNDEVRVVIKENDVAIQSRYHSRRLADRAPKRSSIEVFMNMITAMQYEFTPEEIVLKYEELKDSFQAEDDLNSLNKGSTGDAFFLFKPGKGYFVTPILIYLNIFIFLVMVLQGVGFLSPSGEDLLRWGANFRPATLDGEWWRLITCCFLHIGALHLFMNMYALMFIGVLLEPYLGKARFICAYLLTGIVASMASLAWHDHTISAGASGAIFGMYGVFLAMLTTNLIEKSVRKALFVSIGVFILYNLGNGMQSGIDNAAHIGGLVSGLIIGYAFYPSLSKPQNRKLANSSMAVVTVVIIIATVFAFAQFPKDIVKYEERMNVFASYEQKALQVDDLPAFTPKGEHLILIQSRYLNNSRQMLAIMDQVKDMDLPQSVKERNKLLYTYSELLLRNYECYYKKVETGNRIYDDSLEVYGQKIETVVQQLKDSR
jgi:rhomboid protease GluP